MRNINLAISFIILFLFAIINTQAQGNLDCVGATFVCGSSDLSGNNTGPGEINDFASPNNMDGCLGGENFSNWFIFEAATSGTLTFVITPNTLSNDYDFAVFGPDRTCNNLGSPVRCNYSGTSGLTGLSTTATLPSVGAGGSPFSSALNVNAGETYYILIDNFSESGSGFSLSWGGTADLVALSDAAMDFDITCNVVQFTNETTSCLTDATYTWDFGDGTTSSEENPSHIYTAVDTYTVSLTINGAGGETSSVSEGVIISSIGSPDEIEIINVESEYCIDASAVDLSTNGSPAGGSFSIAGTTITEIIPSGLGAGNHDLIYTHISSTGCVETASQVITINALPTLGFVNLADDYCIDADNVSLQANPSGGDFTVNGTPETNFNISDLGLGTHTVGYTYTDGNNCTNILEKTVTINPLPTPEFVDLADEYCSNADNVTLQGSPSGGSFTVNGNPETSFNATDLGVGTHTVIYTYTDENTCMNTVEKTIEVLPPTELEIVDLLPEYCIDADNVVLQATPEGGDFTVNGNPETSFNASDLGAGTHTVTYTYTSESTCTNSVEQVVVINPLPTLDFVDLSDAYCIDADDITLQATPTGGDFTVNGSFVTSFNVSDLGIGTHTVTYTYTDENTCTHIIEKDVIINALPVLDINIESAYCLNAENIDLSDKFTSDKDGTPTFSIDGTNITEISPADLGVGTHELVLQFTDINTCESIISQSFEILDIPVLEILTNLDVSYCNDAEAIPLQASPNDGEGGTGFFTVDGVVADVIDPIALGSGTFPVIYTFTDESTNCTNTIEETLTVVDLSSDITINLDIASTYCYNDASIALNGDIVDPTGGTFFIDGVVSTVINPSELSTGEHLLVYQFGDDCINPVSRSFVIHPQQELSPSNLNPNYCIENPAFDLVFTPNNGTLVIDGTVRSNRTFNPSALGLGEHTVEYLSDTGCDTLTRMVNIFPPPAPIIIEGETTICSFSGDSLTLDAGAGDIYLWESTVAGFPRRTRQINIGQSGTYTITVTDSLGCIVTNTFEITEFCDPVFAIPNAFSPNGDGLNDIFEVLGEGIHFYKYEMVIFNRWGEIVFKGNVKSDVWDGSFRGKPAPEGTYVCIIKYQELPDGVGKEVRAKLTLIR